MFGFLSAISFPQSWFQKFRFLSFNMVPTTTTSTSRSFFRYPTFLHDFQFLDKRLSISGLPLRLQVLESSLSIFCRPQRFRFAEFWLSMPCLTPLFQTFAYLSFNILPTSGNSNFLFSSSNIMPSFVIWHVRILFLQFTAFIRNFQF